MRIIIIYCMKEIKEKTFDRYMKNKILVIFGESFFFIITIIYGIKIIQKSISGIFLDFIDAYRSIDFILFISCFIGLISFPEMISMIRKLMFSVRIFFNAKAFRNHFLDDFRKVKEIEIEELIKKYNISLDEVDRTFEQLIHKELLRGLFDRKDGKRIFVVQSDFEILPVKERPLYNLNHKLIHFLNIYKSISLENLASNFHITIDQVEEAINDLIDDGYITGVITESTYYQDPSIINKLK